MGTLTVSRGATGPDRVALRWLAVATLLVATAPALGQVPGQVTYSFFPAQEYVPGQALTVNLMVTQFSWGRWVRLEDEYPPGWQISGVDPPAGQVTAGKVTWSMDLPGGTSRTFSYKATPPPSASGLASFYYSGQIGNDSTPQTIPRTRRPVPQAEGVCAFSSCSATPSATTGAAPLTVTFQGQAAASGCTGAVTYDWDYGDGSTHGSGATASHTYASPGDHPWAMTARADAATCRQAGTIHVTAASYTLTVTKAGSGSGTVTSTPAGISCGATCSASFPAGGTVTLAAAPAAGSSFAGWTGDCGGTGGCSVTMGQSHSVTASFESGGGSWTASHFVGPLVGPGYTDGTGSAARFNEPNGVAVDASGTLYVADFSNHAIRKVTPEGTVTTFAGSPGRAGSTDGVGAEARFYHPLGLAFDRVGNLLVADGGNHTIRTVTPAGLVSTLAGKAGAEGSADGPGTEARFYWPCGIAVDAGGNVLVADQSNHAIRRISPAGAVTTLAGLAGTSGTDDGTGNAARFHWPAGIAVDSHGDALVADGGNYAIRKVTPQGVVTTLAGTPGEAGAQDGTGTSARFGWVSGIALSSTGELLATDYNRTIRRVTAAGQVTTVAGQAYTAGTTDGPGTEARFRGPAGIACDAGGKAYITDDAAHTVRAMTGAFVVSTLAGSPPEGSGKTNGTGAAARFWWPYGVALDSQENAFVADSSNCTIRKVSPLGEVTTFAGVASYCENTDGTGAAARFNQPEGLAIDASGTIYVADAWGNSIRKVTPDRNVVTLAGSNAAGSSDGTGRAAQFDLPRGVAVDASGTIFVADTNNHTIRKVSPAGVVTTLAGLAGSQGAADGNGAAARFNSPGDVAVGADGALYVADSGNRAVRKVTAAGEVTTLVPPQCELLGCFSPVRIAVGSGGTLYATDDGAVRSISAGGQLTTLAGLPGSSGSEDGVGSAARFNSPNGIAVTAAGELLVADAASHCIRKLTRSTACKPGDCNCDGQVSITELQQVVNNQLRLTSTGCGDCDGDGKVSITELQATVNCQLRLPSCTATCRR